MKRVKIYSLMGIFMLLTAPWLHLNHDIFGFPFWTVYCLMMSIIFAFVMAILIEYFWN